MTCSASPTKSPVGIGYPTGSLREERPLGLVWIVSLPKKRSIEANAAAPMTHAMGSIQAISAIWMALVMATLPVTALFPGPAKDLG